MPIKASPDALVDFGACVLQATGVPAADARLLADSLVAAELWGHSSHGMLRLPWYVERLRQGAMQPVTHATMAVDHGAVVVLDGHDGIGQVLTQQAVDLGIGRARRHGISAVGVRNSNHFGTAAYFTRRSAEAGCVAILATNASVEGESTALFLERQIRDAKINTDISRLARGIPVGVDLEYADQITLGHALEGRRTLS